MRIGIALRCVLMPSDLVQASKSATTWTASLLTASMNVDRPSPWQRIHGSTTYREQLSRLIVG